VKRLCRQVEANPLIGQLFAAIDWYSRRGPGWGIERWREPRQFENEPGAQWERLMGSATVLVDSNEASRANDSTDRDDLRRAACKEVLSAIEDWRRLYFRAWGTGVCGPLMIPYAMGYLPPVISNRRGEART
jgi:hypothetical protein